MFLPSLGNFQTILPPLLFSDSSSLVQANDLFVDNIHQEITLVVLGFKGAFLEQITKEATYTQPQRERNTQGLYNSFCLDFCPKYSSYIYLDSFILVHSTLTDFHFCDTSLFTRTFCHGQILACAYQQSFMAYSFSQAHGKVAQIFLHLGLCTHTPSWDPLDNMVSGGQLYNFSGFPLKGQVPVSQSFLWFWNSSSSDSLPFRNPLKFKITSSSPLLQHSVSLKEEMKQCFAK